MGRNISMDFQSEMSNLFNHIKKTKNHNSELNDKPIIYVDKKTFQQLNERKTLQKSFDNSKIKAHFNKTYFKNNFEIGSLLDEEDLNYKNQFNYMPFKIFAKNYFNFKGSGSALGVKLGLKESQELIQIKEKSIKKYNEIIQKSFHDSCNNTFVEELNRKGIELQTNKFENNNNSAKKKNNKIQKFYPHNENLPSKFSIQESTEISNGYFLNPKMETGYDFEVSSKNQALKLIDGKERPDKIDYRKKGISKTACFSYSGNGGPLLFYWNTHKINMIKLVLKTETKKIRMVANADLNSFIKQSYLYDWLVNTLNPRITNKINSLLNSKERIKNIVKMGNSFSFEKWCVPTDLKNFHEHFGISHLLAFCQILKNSIKSSVENLEIKENLIHILERLENDFRNSFLVIDFKSEKNNLFTDLKDFEFCENLERKSNEKKNKFIYSYSIKLKVKNGLMSGWKLTSILGSLFNLNLNFLCQKWSLLFSKSVNSDLNVLGDDCHMKTRYLSHALNQIDFINALGKEAHPEKQMISSVYTEFLKKTINTIDGSIR